MDASSVASPGREQASIESARVLSAARACPQSDTRRSLIAKSVAFLLWMTWPTHQAADAAVKAVSNSPRVIFPSSTHQCGKLPIGFVYVSGDVLDQVGFLFGLERQSPENGAGPSQTREAAKRLFQERGGIGRGRDTSCPAPPAQIPTCELPA